MADYRAIPNAEVDPNAPVTSELAYAWRDNPIAIAEGAPGAPRLTFDALGAWYSTAGAIGSYVFAARITAGTTDVSFGATVAGSTLGPTGALRVADGSNTIVAGSALSGTWRCMGEYDYSGGGNSRGATLWIRIS